MMNFAGYEMREDFPRLRSVVGGSDPKEEKSDHQVAGRIMQDVPNDFLFLLCSSPNERERFRVFTGDAASFWCP